MGAIITAFNPASITIPTQGTAIPYPSFINIAVSGTIIDVNISLSDVNHTFPDDFGALLVGPGGQTVVLFNGHGDGTDIVDVDWTFDDEAAGPLPAASALASGTFQPGNIFPADNFPAFSPVGPYGPVLSVFDGTDDLLGGWSLYIADFVDGYGGSIDSGWSLEIEYTAVPEPSAFLCVGLIAIGSLGWKKLRK